MKAQAGVEYLFMVGFGILILTAFWIYANNNTGSTEWGIEIAQAKNSMDKIVQAADMIYIQGEPAQIYVYPTFPTCIRNVSMVNRTIRMVLIHGSMNVTIYGDASVNITGIINPLPGNRKILIRAIKGAVEVNG